MMMDVENNCSKIIQTVAEKLSTDLQYSTAKEILKELNAIKSNVFGFSDIIFMQSLIRRIILFVPQQKFFTNKDEEQESAKDLKLRNSRKPPPHTYPDDTKNCCSCSSSSSSSSSSCFYDPSNPFSTRQQSEEGGGEEEVWEDKNWGSDVSSWESFLSVLVHASSSVLDVLITQEPSLLSVFVRDTTDLLEDALNVVDLELSNNDCGGSGGAELNSQTKLSVTDGDVVRVYAYQKFCERCKIDDIILEIPNAGVLSQIIGYCIGVCSEVASNHSHTIWREGITFWSLWERSLNFRFLFPGNFHINSIVTSIPTLLHSGLQSPPQRFVDVAFASTLALCRLVGERPAASLAVDNLSLGRSLASLHSLLAPLSMQASCENLAAVALSNAQGGEASQNTFSNAAVMKAISVSSGSFSPSLVLYLSQLSDAYCTSQMVFYVVNAIKNAVVEYYLCFRNERALQSSMSPTSGSQHQSPSSPVAQPPPQKRRNVMGTSDPEGITDSDTEAKMIISSIAVILARAESFTFHRNDIEEVGRAINLLDALREVFSDKNSLEYYEAISFLYDKKLPSRMGILFTLLQRTLNIFKSVISKSNEKDIFVMEPILRISLILKKVVMFMPPSAWVHVAEDIITFSRVLLESPLLASRLSDNDSDALQVASNLLFVVAFMPQQFSPASRVKCFEMALSSSSTPLFWVALKRLPLLIVLVKNSSATLFKLVINGIKTSKPYCGLISRYLSHCCCALSMQSYFDDPGQQPPPLDKPMMATQERRFRRVSYAAKVGFPWWYNPKSISSEYYEDDELLVPRCVYCDCQDPFFFPPDSAAPSGPAATTTAAVFPIEVLELILDNFSEKKCLLKDPSSQISFVYLCEGLSRLLAHVKLSGGNGDAVKMGILLRQCDGIDWSQTFSEKECSDRRTMAMALARGIADFFMQPEMAAPGTAGPHIREVIQHWRGEGDEDASECLLAMLGRIGAYQRGDGCAVVVATLLKMMYADESRSGRSLVDDQLRLIVQGKGTKIGALLRMYDEEIARTFVPLIAASCKRVQQFFRDIDGSFDVLAVAKEKLLPNLVFGSMNNEDCRVVLEKIAKAQDESLEMLIFDNSSSIIIKLLTILDVKTVSDVHTLLTSKEVAHLCSLSSKIRFSELFRTNLSDVVGYFSVRLFEKHSETILRTVSTLMSSNGDNMLSTQEKNDELVSLLESHLFYIIHCFEMCTKEANSSKTLLEFMTRKIHISDSLVKFLKLLRKPQGIQKFINFINLLGQKPKNCDQSQLQQGKIRQLTLEFNKLLCSVWREFLHRIDVNLLQVDDIYNITSSVLGCLEHCPREAASVLEKLLIRDSPKVSECMSHLPEIPAIPETARLREYIHTKLSIVVSDWRKELDVQLAGLRGEFAAVETSLEKIRVLIRENLAAIYAESDGDDTSSSLVSKIIVYLLMALRRVQSDRARDTVCRCLGELGAVDPARIQTTSFRKSFRFSGITRNKLGIALLSQHLVPLLHKKTNFQNCVSFAIQEILKIFGAFKTDGVISQNGLSFLAELPKDIAPAVEPYQDTNYVLNANVETQFTPKYPMRYHSWLRFCMHTVFSFVSKADPCRPIYSPCLVVANFDKPTAEFLLPYLVWSVMTLGTEEHKKKVMELLTGTLKESQDKTKYSEGSQCVQFVFNIIDSLNKLVSENAKIKDKHAAGSTPRRSGRGTGADRGSSGGDQLFLGFDSSPQFLEYFNTMLDDVAFDVFKAAISSKSYPRALLYFEKYAKITNVTNATLGSYYEQLQEAYLNLDDIDSLSYISSIAKDASSKDYIRYLEYAGKWHEALICYDTALSLSSSSSSSSTLPVPPVGAAPPSATSLQPRPPLDPSLILGRLECMKEVGHFDTMLSLVHSHLSSHYYIPQLQAQYSHYQQQQQQLQRQKSMQQQQQGPITQTPMRPPMSSSPFYMSSIMSSVQPDTLLTGSLSTHSPSSLSSSSLSSVASMSGDVLPPITAQIPPPPPVSGNIASFVSSLVSYGVQASWRLGQWEQLNSYINDPMCPKQSQSWEVAVGSGILALFERNKEYLSAVIDNARSMITKSITVASFDSYQRCYPDMVKLHILHEMEQIGELLPSSSSSSASAANSSVSNAATSAGASNGNGTGADNDAAIMKCLVTIEKSLDITQPSLKAREPILNVTKMLYKIFQNKNEGKIWLKIAKLARKSGNIQTAYSAIQKAKECVTPEWFIEEAKLQWVNGSLLSAMGTLKLGVEKLLAANDLSYSKTIGRGYLLLGKLSEAMRMPRIEVEAQYNNVQHACCSWEKGYFFLGKYSDSIILSMESSADGKALADSEAPLDSSLVNSAIVNYLFALKYGARYLFHSLPRVLTLWSMLHAQKDSSPAQRIDVTMKTFQTQLPPFIWLSSLTQLKSLYINPNFANCKPLLAILQSIVNAYPLQAIWRFMDFIHSDDRENKDFIRQKADKLFQMVSVEIKDLFNQNRSFTKCLIDLARYSPQGRQIILGGRNGHSSLTQLGHIKNLKLIMPFQRFLTPAIPAVYTPTSKVFSDNLLRISGVSPEVDVMSSLAKPKKIQLIATDGRKYLFLCKPNDDPRVDARVMEVLSLVNGMLRVNPDSRKRNFYIRTYSVLPLTETVGLIEWVPDTVTFKSAVLSFQGSFLVAGQKAEWEKSMSVESKRKEYFKMMTKRVKCTFSKWFLTQFPDPSAWFDARLSYTRTLAIMSMVGTMIGLGDRHLENILFDSKTGDTVHIDYACVFWKGLTLEYPEKVPFRLTRNLIDGMGFTGYNGVFRSSCEVALSVLRQNAGSLMSVLESFVCDPLLDSKKQNRKSIDHVSTLKHIERVLSGKQDENEKSFPLSVESHVDSLINISTSPQYLSQMYIGWNPWC